jgi:glycosyltransferase involved in cell wall biosynthesis
MARRIAFVLKGYPRLSETFIAQEIRALERLGLDITIYSLRHPTDIRSHPVHGEIKAAVHYLPEYLRDAPGRVAAGLGRMILRPGFWRAAGVWLRDLARDRSANRVRRFGQACVLAAELPDDIGRLHAHFLHTPASVTRYAALMRGIAFSVSAHAVDIWTTPDWEKREKIRAAAFCVTCTEYGRDHLADLAGETGKVVLNYHGLDLERFVSSGAARESTHDGSVAEQTVEILSVGRAVEKKGFDVLLDALARLDGGLHWRFTHIGGGAGLETLKDRTSELGITDRMRFLGAQAFDQVLAAYRQADLFVLPCRIAGNGDRDGLPNVLLEAQSQGLAVISTTVSAVPELIVPGDTGQLVPPEDPAALAAAIADLIRDPALRERFGAAGSRRVREAFSQAGQIGALATLFGIEAPGSVPASSQAAE